MRKSLIALSAILLAGPALAQGRPSTLDMTCGEAAATVASYGAVVMTTGRHTYDRFVAHNGFCSPTEIAEPATAPTLDSRYCRIGYTCEQRLRRFGRY